MNISTSFSRAIEGVDVWRRLPPRQRQKQVQMSVIIPTLQEERILERLLRHFDEETINNYNIELIVSDGGSTDQTTAIARKYADVVATHRAPWRQTIAAGRNVGAYLSSGTVLVFLNADCMPADWEAFWAFLCQWAKGEGPYALYAALAAPVVIAPEERITTDRIVHGVFNAYLSVAAKVGCGVGRGECQVIRRWVFERTGGYNESLVAGEDFEFFHRVRKWTRIAIPRPLLVYESPRRYRRWGYRRILWQWFANWSSALIARRSAAQEWIPVRE